MGAGAGRGRGLIGSGAQTVSSLIPYGRQVIDDDDVAAVTAVLRGDWLTQGPAVEQFEAAFAAATGGVHAVAVNSGTAALHASLHALHLGPGDEVIVPPITFTATANCAVFVGATPVFADVTPSGHLDAAAVERRLTPRTRAILAVDYAGHPCDYAALGALADRHGLALVCDACHALGARWRGRPVGSIGRLNTFSFHPVKHIATGEGGMITTDDPRLAARMREFRTHGITKDAARFLPATACAPLAEQGPWYYEMQGLGFNYRMSDLNCALGLSQLRKLDRFVARRRAVAARYTGALRELPHVVVPAVAAGAEPSWHLYPLAIDFAALGRTRTQVMAALRDRGVGTQVHYIPVCLQPYYRERLGTRPGDFPGAEAFYAQALSIPMFAGLTDADVDHVIASVRAVLA